MLRYACAAESTYGSHTSSRQYGNAKGGRTLRTCCAGGKYAVYHFKGYPQMLYMVYQGVFCRWLSKTGNHIDERPVFDIYRKVEENGYMEIDICFPLK